MEAAKNQRSTARQHVLEENRTRHEIVEMRVSRIKILDTLASRKDNGLASTTGRQALMEPY